ncbi:MAG: C10 family peptidase [Prevotellaceae bacterium]|jgi:hypothetical protein|nr:C10 family peptidase [Prevotellaceae bacterium]
MKEKGILLSKIVGLLCTTTLLFACSTDDDLVFIDEMDQKQEVSSQVNEKDDVFVHVDKATEIADLFFKELTGTSVSTRSGGHSVQTVSDSVKPLMYVVNYANGGFVIIGSTQNYYPVLAYSDKGSFELGSNTGGVSGWLEETKGIIQVSDAFSDSIKASMQGLWSSYENGEDVLSRSIPKTRSENLSPGEAACIEKCSELMQQYGGDWTFLPLAYAPQYLATQGFQGTEANLQFANLFSDANYICSPEASVFAYRYPHTTQQVGPLLNTEWHQDTPFNNLCGGNPAGCGPIAVAQVLQYYQYLPNFTLNGTYSFDWSTIPVEPDPLSDQDALVRFIGGLIGTNYSLGYSHTEPDDMEAGLELLFFDDLYNTVNRSGHNSQTVKNVLFGGEEPVIMLGNDNNFSYLIDPLDYLGPSHYWVCDGARERIDRREYFTLWQPNEDGNFVAGRYSMDDPGSLSEEISLFFHMNWGWGGANNGWYIHNNINIPGVANFQHSRQNFYMSLPPPFANSNQD